MEVEISLNPVCSKCDRHAVAFSEKHLPLCGRHAMIFLTAPRMIARDAQLQQELEQEQWQANEAANDMDAAKAQQANGDGDEADGADRDGANQAGADGDDVLAAILERLTAIEMALGIATQPANSPSTPTVSVATGGPTPAGNTDRRRSDQGRRTTDMRSGSTAVESAHDVSRPWATGGAR